MTRPKLFCAECGGSIEVFTHVGNEGCVPGPGDIVVCLCGAIQRVRVGNANGQLSLKAVSESEIGAMSEGFRARVLGVRRACRLVWQATRVIAQRCTCGREGDPLALHHAKGCPKGCD